MDSAHGIMMRSDQLKEFELSEADYFIAVIQLYGCWFYIIWAKDCFSRTLLFFDGNGPHFGSTKDVIAIQYC